ncbi:hypothetical protein BST37_19985 [Mycobacterium noviomagense]|uniref:Uncharacterized protein n=1 Tax=Mycobacterium noviomagense TaxID=459858 RepID=A0ABX3SZX6_9MYCO|nr:hypothetical protein BST37_19985 [Mycobacterium noviomagense]
MSYDGRTIIDTFTGANNQPNVASGTQNDLATAVGPNSAGSTITATDNAPGDKNDIAYAQGANSTAAVGGTVNGTTLGGAVNSTATAYNGGTAEVGTVNGSSPNTVTNDAATANGAGAVAAVLNDGGTGRVAFDTAKATSTDGAPTVAAVAGEGGSGPVTFNNAVATNNTANPTESVIIGAAGGATTANSANANNGGVTEVVNDNSGNLIGNSATATGQFHGEPSTAGVVNDPGPSTKSVDFNTANASGGAIATVGNDGYSLVNVTGDHATATQNTNVQLTPAGVVDAANSTASASNTGASGGALVEFATNSSANASGEDPNTFQGSTAKVEGQNIPGGYITNSHATATGGGQVDITTSNTTVNDPPGATTVSGPGASTYVAPTAPVHVAPVTPMMPIHMPLLP